MPVYKRMIALLKQGKDKDGNPLDIESFDRVSRKTLRHLCQEILENDVRLFRDKKTDRIARVTRSVKILITFRGRTLREVKREFRNGDVIEGVKEWSVSETQKWGEPAETAAIRGLYEELDYHPKDSSRLVSQLAEENLDVHESNAYIGLMTYVLVQGFELELEELLWERGKIIRDHDVHIYLEWS